MCHPPSHLRAPPPLLPPAAAPPAQGMGTDLGLNALVSNIARAVYKDKGQIVGAVRKMPQFRDTKEFEFAFKVRWGEDLSSAVCF